MRCFVLRCFVLSRRIGATLLDAVDTDDYRMSENEVQSATGLDLVESMLAVYREVIPAMNLCMQIELAER